MLPLLHLAEAVLAVNALVLVHEIGHLAAGRLFRVPSLQFSVGLGPPLLRFRWRGTEYRLASLPLGGYVRLARGCRHGGRETCMDCLGTAKRILVFLAGPAANLVAVVLLLWLAYCGIGFKALEPVVATVRSGSPAEASGIRAGDRIQRVDGKRVVAWVQVLRLLERPSGRVREVIVERSGPAGTRATVRLLLDGRRPAGLVPADRRIRLRVGPVRALDLSLEKLGALVILLGRSILGLVTSKVPASELVGPLYLFHLSSQAAASGPAALLYLSAFVSASLGLFNLLPLPILDGGQAVLAFLQRVMNRPLRRRSLALLTHASLFWLLLLLTSTVLNDLVRLLGS